MSEKPDKGLSKVKAVKVPKEHAAKLSALEARWGVGKSLILRHAAAAVVQAVPRGKVCRFDRSGLGGGDVAVSAQLWASTLEGLDARFPHESVESLMKFSVLVATTVLAREGVLCLPVGLVVVWPQDDVLSPRSLRVSKPRINLAEELFEVEAYDRGQPWQSRVYSAGFVYKTGKNSPWTG